MACAVKDKKRAITPDDIKAIREIRDWSPTDLARALGCAQSTVWRMENGGNISGPSETILRGLLDNPPERDDTADRIIDAAKWIATEKAPSALKNDVTPELTRLFGLSALQAQHAIAEAKLIWARSL
jgi:transcriptional regulator with XRE-family HTH domain